LGASTTAQ